MVHIFQDEDETLSSSIYFIRNNFAHLSPFLVKKFTPKILGKTRERLADIPILL